MEPHRGYYLAILMRVRDSENREEVPSSGTIMLQKRLPCSQNLHICMCVCACMKFHVSTKKLFLQTVENHHFVCFDI